MTLRLPIRSTKNGILFWKSQSPLKVFSPKNLKDPPFSYIPVQGISDPGTWESARKSWFEFAIFAERFCNGLTDVTEAWQVSKWLVKKLLRLSWHMLRFEFFWHRWMLRRLRLRDLFSIFSGRWIGWIHIQRTPKRWPDAHLSRLGARTKNNWEFIIIEFWHFGKNTILFRIYRQKELRWVLQIWITIRDPCLIIIV